MLCLLHSRLALKELKAAVTQLAHQRWVAANTCVGEQKKISVIIIREIIQENYFKLFFVDVTALSRSASAHERERRLLDVGAASKRLKKSRNNVFWT